MSRKVSFTEEQFLEALMDALEFSNSYNVTDYDYDYWVGVRSFLRLVWHNLTHKKKLKGNGLPGRPEYFEFEELELSGWRLQLLKIALKDSFSKTYIRTAPKDKS